MRGNHHIYAGADPHFYDHPAGRTEDRRFAASDRPAPEGWLRDESRTWICLAPVGKPLPDQGWKIHVSATTGGAEEVVELVGGWCLAAGLAYKHLPDHRTHLLNNSKYARRGSSGKLLTVYPVDEAELRSALDGLGTLLKGRQGPYVLGDLRWQDGPLYLRHGGFRERWCTDERGERVLAVARPDGTLVPDRRGPCFELPEWVTPPDFVAAQLAADAAAGQGVSLPYDVESALHFSNGGGVYLAREQDGGRAVVLREARPLAGLDGAGTDAVGRLHQEAEALRALAGLPWVPELYREFTVWEHHYLAEEYVEGETLRQFLARQNPLIRPEPSAAQVAEYTARALDLIDQLEQAVTAVHERGWAFGDLHPANVLIRPDGRICLVDFEVAHRPGTDPAPTMGCPGYVAPHVNSGFERDRYGLDAIRLALFLPITMVLDLAPGKLDELADAMAELYPVPAAHTERVRTGLRRPGHHPAGGPELFDGPAEELRAAVVRSITAAATPGRADRLFPGDPAGLRDGGYTLVHGAAGVLHALDATGHPVAEEHTAWLLRAVRHTTDPRPGLYDGLHGAALTLHRLGHTEQALDAVARAGRPTTPGLRAGLAGVGLALHQLALATGDGGLEDELRTVTERLAAALDAPWTGAGLLTGPSGAAAYFLERYRHQDDPALLELAARALRADLAHCATSEEGAVNLKDGTRLLPYLGTGSGGIGLVLGRYLRHRPDEEFATALDGILYAARAGFTLYGDLFAGRAGLLALLTEHRDRPGTEELIERHVRRLSWHAVPHGGGLAFTGEQLYRLSTDLATGSAGVLLALHAAAGAPLALPGLSPAAHLSPTG
ncbi:class III lanthionine synthetase LanKC [Kitasatospora sp. NPDC096147]|uniref:class III lanthionine synthetase LanKC n=1 Tax=Kitasatospora sp. NPDC096147 TaxID=3364093 RepID=UPI003814BB3B